MMSILKYHQSPCPMFLLRLGNDYSIKALSLKWLVTLQAFEILRQADWGMRWEKISFGRNQLLSFS